MRAQARRSGVGGDGQADAHRGAGLGAVRTSAPFDAAGTGDRGATPGRLPRCHRHTTWLADAVHRPRAAAKPGPLLGWTPHRRMVRKRARITAIIGRTDIGHERAPLLGFDAPEL